MATASAAPAAAAPAAATTAVSAAPAAATAGSFRLRPCFIHHQVASAEVLPVQRVHRAIRILVIVYFHEGEPARLPRKTVTNQIDSRGGDTDLRKPLLKLLLRSRKRKIPYIELLHLPNSFCPEPNCESRSAPKRRES